MLHAPPILSFLISQSKNIISPSNRDTPEV